MAFERITLDINANGEMPTFHCKQFDIGRPIIIDLVAGDDDYTPAAGVTFELYCRKVDMNLVVISEYEIDSNQITFASTEQLTACVGDNLATLKLFKDDLEIATMNFIINVAIDPEAQGIVSDTVIDNLTTQIEEITEQVIGENYYDKEEVDDLLDLKADAADVYTKTETDTMLSAKADKSDTYTKSQVDSALTLKADKSDTYTKAQVDSALSAKANTADLATVATTGDYDDLLNKPSIPAAQVQSDYAQSDNTQVDYIKNKPDINGMINDAILQIMPVGTASGSIANFETELALPYQSVTVDVLATGGNGTPDNPIPINGYTEANIVNTQNESIVDLFSIDSDFRGTVAFNQLIQNGNFESAMAWSAVGGTLSVNNNIGTYTVSTVGSAIYSNTLQINISNIANHKSFVRFSIKPAHTKTMRIYCIKSGDGSNFYKDISVEGGSWNLIEVIINPTTANTYTFIQLALGCTSANGYSVGDTDDIKYFNVIDLTQMFGSTIADYIYGLEQNNVGDGVAFFRSIYPADYYDYDVGTNELVGKITPNATITFGQTVYGGVLDVTSGKLTVTWGIVDLGTCTYTKMTVGSYEIFHTTIADKALTTAGLCSDYENSENPRDQLLDNQFGTYNLAGGRNIVCIRDDSKASLSTSDFKTAMSGVMLAYELATPFDVDLTPVQISAIVGENNVYSDTNGDTTVQYKDSIQHYIDTRL